MATRKNEDPTPAVEIPKIEHGKFFFSNGGVYEGQCRKVGDNYIKEGQGSYTAGNQVIKGIFINDSLTSGTITWSDGTIYEGELFNGFFHGSGSLTHPGKDTFTGHWNNGQCEGYGKLQYKSFPSSDPIQIEGFFHKGEYNPSEKKQEEAKAHHLEQQRLSILSECIKALQSFLLDSSTGSSLCCAEKNSTDSDFFASFCDVAQLVTASMLKKDNYLLQLLQGVPAGLLSLVQGLLSQSKEKGLIEGTNGGSNGTNVLVPGSAEHVEGLMSKYFPEKKVRTRMDGVEDCFVFLVSVDGRRGVVLRLVKGRWVAMYAIPVLEEKGKKK